jgi:hypothetical protein
VGDSVAVERCGEWEGRYEYKGEGGDLWEISSALCLYPLTSEMT